MNRIIHINLSDLCIHEEPYSPAVHLRYGKSLAGWLVKRHVNCLTDRFSSKNCLVFAPGLLSGTTTPCTGRITVAAKEQQDKGTQFANIGGPFAQKLASLNIAAVVVTGQNQTDSPAVINISLSGVSIVYLDSLKKAPISDIVAQLRSSYGENSSILGVGHAGDTLLPLAAIFSTYPPGEPVYTCARGGMGDIWGAKGLKAIVVNAASHFGSEVFDQDALNNTSRLLSKSIIEHKICGGALPAYGSITLMKLMAGKGGLKLDHLPAKPVTTTKSSQNSVSGTYRINRACAPLCVIGCLNRHSSGGNRLFRSPADSEVLAALNECFHIDDPEFASALNFKAYELGLDSVEFVFSCALFYKLEGIQVTQRVLMDSIDEIAAPTLTGRVLASKTTGIIDLYRNRSDLKAMVTKPSIEEGERFHLSLPYKPDAFAALDDRDFLYAWMTLLSSFGVCLFGSFAIIESEHSLVYFAELFRCKTGITTTPEQLIASALNCLAEEADYERSSKNKEPLKKIPEFVKVLHRYFSSDNTNHILETNE